MEGKGRVVEKVLTLPYDGRCLLGGEPQKLSMKGEETVCFFNYYYYSDFTAPQIEGLEGICSRLM